MALDMNPFAGGQMPAPGANPAAGAAAPQKATSVPGAVSNMVQALMSGYGKYKANQAALPGMSTGPSPDFPAAPTGPQLGASPDFPPAGAVGPGSMPGPMPGAPLPMQGSAVPFAGAGGLGNIFGGGSPDPQNLAISALFGGQG